MSPSRGKQALSASHFAIGLIVGCIANGSYDTNDTKRLTLTTPAAHQAAAEVYTWLRTHYPDLEPVFQIELVKHHWTSQVWETAVNTAQEPFDIIRCCGASTYTAIKSPDNLQRYWSFLPGDESIWREAAKVFIEHRDRNPTRKS